MVNADASRQQLLDPGQRRQRREQIGQRLDGDRHRPADLRQSSITLRQSLQRRFAERAQLKLCRRIGEVLSRRHRVRAIDSDGAPDPAPQAIGRRFAGPLGEREHHDRQLLVLVELVQETVPGRAGPRASGPLLRSRRSASGRRSPIGLLIEADLGRRQLTRLLGQVGSDLDEAAADPVRGGVHDVVHLVVAPEVMLQGDRPVMRPRSAVAVADRSTTPPLTFASSRSHRSASVSCGRPIRRTCELESDRTRRSGGGGGGRYSSGFGTVAERRMT